ncbi:uncharacterized protein Triagg1_2004 [Trichoderma aggressivum f. europaeum]|uniref:Uncharacterized protein n=1 Tax=Trichoderma aggressivum f. europaeum TaxID=173218 RepID=A0AAE1IJ43_9HYPO|nr:hypothetical protein Triagg1_2004 [Trichoderma aggressivum f. europaeum]
MWGKRDIPPSRPFGRHPGHVRTGAIKSNVLDRACGRPGMPSSVARYCVPVVLLQGRQKRNHTTICPVLLSSTAACISPNLSPSSIESSSPLHRVTSPRTDARCPKSKVFLLLSLSCLSPFSESVLVQQALILPFTSIPSILVQPGINHQPTRLPLHSASHTDTQRQIQCSDSALAPTAPPATLLNPATPPYTTPPLPTPMPTSHKPEPSHPSIPALVLVALCLLCTHFAAIGSATTGD